MSPKQKAQKLLARAAWPKSGAALRRARASAVRPVRCAVRRAAQAGQWCGDHFLATTGRRAADAHRRRTEDAARRRSGSVVGQRHVSRVSRVTGVSRVRDAPRGARWTRRRDRQHCGRDEPNTGQLVTGTLPGHRTPAGYNTEVQDGRLSGCQGHTAEAPLAPLRLRLYLYDSGTR